MDLTSTNADPPQVFPTVIQPVSRYAWVRWFTRDGQSPLQQRIASLKDALVAESSVLVTLLRPTLTEAIETLKLSGGIQVTNGNPKRSGCYVQELSDDRFVLHFPELVAVDPQRPEATRIVIRIAVAIGNSADNRRFGPCLKMWSRLILDQVDGSSAISPARWIEFVRESGTAHRAIIRRAVFEFVEKRASSCELQFDPDRTHEIFVDAANTTDARLGEILRDIDLGRITSISDLAKDQHVCEEFGKRIEALGYEVVCEDNTIRLISPRPGTATRTEWITPLTLPINSLFYKQEKAVGDNGGVIEVTGFAYAGDSGAETEGVSLPAFTSSALVEADIGSKVR